MQFDKSFSMLIRLDEKENLTDLQICFLTGANNEDRKKIEDLGLDAIRPTMYPPWTVLCDKYIY